MRFRWVWPWAALCLCALPGFGQERVLTIDEALALARERAASVVLAEGRIEEARARQAQAGRRFQENPAVEVNGGYRRAEDDFLDFEAAVTQDLDAGRRRSARLAGAQAALDRAEAELDGGPAAAPAGCLDHLRPRPGGRRPGGAAGAEPAGRRRAAGHHRAAVRSRRGDRARAEPRPAPPRRARGPSRARREAEGSAALAELKALLGLPPGETVEIRGSLAPRPPLDLEPLLAGLDQRPDLRALAAELREAEAEVLLGQALARPDLGVRGGVGREEGAEIVTAGVVVTPPDPQPRPGDARRRAGPGRGAPPGARRRPRSRRRGGPRAGTRPCRGSSRRCGSWNRRPSPPWTTTNRSP